VFDMRTNPPTTLAPTVVNGFLKDIDPKNVLLAPVGLNAFDFNGFVPTTYSYHFGVQSKLPWISFWILRMWARRIAMSCNEESERHPLRCDVPSAESGLHEVFRRAHVHRGLTLARKPLTPTS